MIEIGHGLGLNASNCGKGKAASTDEEYLKVASSILKKAKFGMFFIPGIGRKIDLDLAQKYNMDFVRVGTNVTEIKEAKKYIKYAKDLGMFVSSNLMKSYALTPAKFAKKAKLAEKYGADIIVLVDSAGGMLAKDVKKYLTALKKETNVIMGYHGHNNLSLAIANSLTAIENGVTMIDSSLRGIGRSAGNTQTEILITVLKKLGFNLDIDIYKTMDLAENLIKPYMGTHKGIDSIAITSGYAEFHSSFLDTIYSASKKYSIDPRELIVKVCEKDKIYAPADLTNELAKELHEERMARSNITRRYIDRDYNLVIQKSKAKLKLPEKARMIARNMVNISKKVGKQVIFTINISIKPSKLNFVYPFIQESSSYLMATSELKDKSQILQVVKAIDGLVDFIIIDDEKKDEKLIDILPKVKKVVKKSKVLTYKDNYTWIQAIDNFIAQLQKDLLGLKIVILGLNDLSKKLSISIAERGAKVYLCDRKKEVFDIVEALNLIKLKTTPYRIQGSLKPEHTCRSARIIIGFDLKQQITDKMIKKMDGSGVIIDAVFGTLTPEAIEVAKQKGITIWRTDMRAALAGEITTVLRTNNLMNSIGKGSIGNIPIVAGGYMGDKGDVVVDSISNPTQVIGIADGFGSILYKEEEKYKKILNKVELEIIKRKVLD